MPTCSIEQTEAVRRYYAAFPALKKGEESPLQYYLPPPAWCRKTTTESKVKMQSELLMSKDWNSKNKKYTSGKERRNSYHTQKKNRKRYNSYSKSFESKENLPEWMTHEGVWDMETQDPVKDFIRALALDEGYGTCENTITDEIKDITQAKLGINETMVPNWDDSINLDPEWVITEDLNTRVRTPMEEELYAKFEAKFDRSIEALWSKDQNTPDDEYQDLPIDFHDLLSSPSDQLFAHPSAEKCSLTSLTDSIWSNNEIASTVNRPGSPTAIADSLHDRFRPLTIAEREAPPLPLEIDSFALYEGDELYYAFPTVAKSMRSFTAINHSHDHSGFVEVPPRRRPADLPPVSPPQRITPKMRKTPVDRDDLLTSSETHFRPIRREPEVQAARYADGDTFDIRGELDPVEFRRSESGGVYHEGTLERYLEYRVARSIDYGRLNLTAAQRCPDLDDPGFRLRFPIRQIDAGIQTEQYLDSWECDDCGGSAKKMRQSAIRSIWSEQTCRCGAVPVGAGGGGAERAAAPPPDELSREWEELLEDISEAHRLYATEASDALDEMPCADRKRRHSAALRCAAPCTHPHARFLHCCVAALDRPLTR